LLIVQAMRLKAKTEIQVLLAEFMTDNSTATQAARFR